MLLYGTAGAGKTTAAMSFPSPYVIDTERGAENPQYLKLLKEKGGALFQCSDFGEVFKEVKALLSEKHEYKTLVIDPLTTIYNDLVDTAANDPTEKDPTAFGRHYAVANKHMKKLLQLLLRLDMNVIITTHAKNEYGNNMSVIGLTYDCYKKLDYLFDLVLEIQKLGKVRTGVVRKSRIATFDEYEEFEFSYKVIAQKYGADVLEKNAEAEVLAVPAQIKEVARLIELLKIPAENIDKWYAKANCGSFEEMSSTHIDACIAQLQKKINTKENDK